MWFPLGERGRLRLLQETSWMAGGQEAPNENAEDHRGIKVGVI